MKRKKTYVVILSVLLIIALRYFLFTPFRIPSGSMMPTLMIGDFILVEKFSYNFKLPFIGTREPQRGDVVVFKNRGAYYIKRIIGIPGDTIHIDREGTVSINGKIQEERAVDDLDSFREIFDTYKNHSPRFFSVNAGRYSYVVQKNGDNVFRLAYNETEIPQGNYFVMGDNRDFSHDSRFWGLLKRDSIVGKAIFVWFSMTTPWERGGFIFRPRRIGRPIR